VTVLSAFERRIPVRTIVPPFAALRRVQDKHAAQRTLTAVGLPQPRSVVATSEHDLLQVTRFPVFVKRPVSTASSGVRRVWDAGHLAGAARDMGLHDGGVLVQEQVSGPLAMIQAVADHGRLVAWHANLRVREGAGGGASSKESIPLPRIAEHMGRLSEALGWHGPISLDAILTPDGPVYIDINPRLVEPRNAWLAGVDLVALTLALALGEHPPASLSPRAGVRTHQLLLAVLGAAQGEHARRAVARELITAARRRGAYEQSAEELTPIVRDPLAAVPVAAAAVLTLARPQTWPLFVRGSVDAYALSPQGWAEILRAVDGASAAP
jgi:predicted ATP-grasp superfamily ATP-dependent carboligase